MNNEKETEEETKSQRRAAQAWDSARGVVGMSALAVDHKNGNGDGEGGGSANPTKPEVDHNEEIAAMLGILYRMYKPD